MGQKIIFLFAAISIGGLLTPSIRAQRQDSIETVVESYLDHIGGIDRLRAIKSVKMVEVAEGKTERSAPETTAAKYYAGSKFLIENSDGSRSAYDGKQRWSESADGRFSTHEEPLTVRSLDDDTVGFAMWLHANMDRLRMNEAPDRDDNAISILVAAPVDLDDFQRRNWPTEIVFDGSTGLLKQIRFRNSTTTYGDYRKVDDVLIPFLRVEEYDAGDFKAKFEIHLTSVEVNVQLDENFFAAPKDIKER